MISSRCARHLGSMNRASTLLLTAGLATFAACVSHAPPPEAAGTPVLVEGRLADLRVLAGRWAGEFHDERTRRHGSITFLLEAGRDTAYARIVLAGAPPVGGCVDPISTVTLPLEGREFTMQLARVAVSQGSVGGWLLPYPDPQAGCPVDTWFEGLLVGDRLEGVYFARLTDGRRPTRQGTWQVRRIR